MTPLGLLSFRKNMTPRSGGVGSDSSDDDDGGWVHGGKYCPAKTTSHQPTSTSATPNVDNNIPSPYSMLSPAALDTPLPQESMAAATTPSAATQQQHMTQRQTQARPSINNTRTPLTIQLQRLLQPTPSSLQTPTNNNDNITTPSNYSQRQQLTPPLHPPTTPIQQFLQSSGVTPSASHIIGNIVLTTLFNIVYNVTIIIWSNVSNFIINVTNSQFPNLKWDVVPDIILSLYETIIELYQLVCVAIKFMSPYVLWIIQTSIALVLTIIGTLLWGIVLLFKGLSSSRKEQTSSSSGNGGMISIVGNVQTSAVKSLKENVLNSPFVKKFSGNSNGGRLPFDGFTNVQNQVNNNGVLASSLGNTVSTNANAIVSNNAPISTNSRPTTSAMRRSLLKQAHQTPHNNTTSGSTATPSTANTRRVLFSETDSGEVSTEQFMFDKHLPASARKDRPRNGNGGGNNSGGRLSGKMSSQVVGESVGGATVQQQQRQQSVAENTPPREEVATGGSVAQQSGSNNASISTDRNTASSVPRGQLQSGQAPQTSSSTTTAAAKKMNEEERLQVEENQKQQYIERYGLLPTITPLSKRYGRMKRQQQQQQGQKALPSSESAANRNNAASTSNAATSSSTTSANTAPSVSTSSRNIKRKRRGDLLGAASRLGRHRRSRLNNGTQSSSLPTVLLRNRTPKRQREDTTKMNQTDEWIWKSMNRTDEKENRLNEDEEQEGNVAKRGKFSTTKSDDSGNNTNSDNVVVGTPPKNPTASSTLPPALTPPKTPGLSKFSLGALTPAPKKVNGSAATDTNDNDASSKPSIPFTFGETNDDKSAAPSTATKTDSATAFSFGSTAATATSSTGTEKSKDTAPPTVTAFSFGNTATTTTSSVETEKKDDTTTASVSGFSFSASSAPSTVSEEKVDNVSGQAKQEASTVAKTSTFAFGSSSQPTPAASQPAPSSGASFSFGKTTPSTAAPAPLTFGQTTPAEQTFGGAQPTTTQPAPGSSGAAFSFGSSSASVAAQPSVANPPTFAFGAASAGGVDNTTPAPAPPNFGQVQTNSTFSLGGGKATTSSGGASSRRRAKASGRRK